MLLHDPHHIPEPILVLSGLTYLVPFYMAIQDKRFYYSATCLFLTLTTVGFHGTRNEIMFQLDCLAILNFVSVMIYTSLKSSNYSKAVSYTSILYSLTSYFIGQQYQNFSFHPDWNTQMLFHSMMHISSSYSAYLFIKETI